MFYNIFLRNLTYYLIGLWVMQIDLTIFLQFLSRQLTKALYLKKKKRDNRAFVQRLILHLRQKNVPKIQES